MPARFRERFVVDENGKASEVVLDIKAYEQLLSRLEDLEDTLELDQARRSARNFRSYDTIRQDLKKAGRL